MPPSFPVTYLRAPMMAPDSGAAGPLQQPMAAYRALRQAGLLEPDPAQQLAVEKLQSLYRGLLHYRPETGLRGWLARFGLGENGGSHAPAGLYLCGPVGFMQAQWSALLAAGVPQDRLHREVFGPELLNYLG